METLAHTAQALPVDGEVLNHRMDEELAWFAERRVRDTPQPSARAPTVNAAPAWPGVTFRPVRDTLLLVDVNKHRWPFVRSTGSRAEEDKCRTECIACWRVLNAGPAQNRKTIQLNNDKLARSTVWEPVEQARRRTRENQAVAATLFVVPKTHRAPHLLAARWAQTDSFLSPLLS